jgi:hypothetical protein
MIAPQVRGDIDKLLWIHIGNGQLMDRKSNCRLGIAHLPDSSLRVFVCAAVTNSVKALSHVGRAVISYLLPNPLWRNTALATTLVGLRLVGGPITVDDISLPQEFSGPLLSIASHISWNPVAGELVLFDCRDGAYHALNGSGAEIWRAIVSGLDEQQTIDALAERYDAPREAIARNVREFIDAALAKNLLLRTEQAG